MSLGLFIVFSCLGSSAVPLKDWIETAQKDHPGVLEIQTEIRSLHSFADVAQSVDDPQLTLTTLRRGPQTRYLSLQQKILFPSKYITAARAEMQKAFQAEARLKLAKLQIRQDVIYNFFHWFISENRWKMSQSQKKLSRSRRDLESQILQFESQQENELADKARKLYKGNLAELVPGIQLPSPNESLSIQMDWSLMEMPLKDLKYMSAHLSQTHFQHKEAQWRKRLSEMSFRPDFTLSYAHRVDGDPIDSHIYSIGINIPLWRSGKNASIAGHTGRFEALGHRWDNEVKQWWAKTQQSVIALKKLYQKLQFWQENIVPKLKGVRDSAARLRMEKKYWNLFENVVDESLAFEKHLGFSILNWQDQP